MSEAPEEALKTDKKVNAEKQQESAAKP